MNDHRGAVVCSSVGASVVLLYPTFLSYDCMSYNSHTPGPSHFGLASVKTSLSQSLFFRTSIFEHPLVLLFSSTSTNQLFVCDETLYGTLNGTYAWSCDN